MPEGLTVYTQESFARGIWRAGSPELIPADACFDLLNGLLDRQGLPFRRGGSVYRSAAAFGAGLRFIWDGWLANGQQTIIASTTAFGRVNADKTVTDLGGGGMVKPGRAAVYNGVLYLPGGTTFDGTFTSSVAEHAVPYYAVVANRLLAAQGDTVWFSKIGKPAEFAANDFHKLPGGVEIIGLAGGRESAVVFTTAGIWIISNMALNLTDSVGNVQQRLDHYAADMTLWGDAGIAAWESGLVVPTTNGVWLIKRGATSEVIQSFERLSDSIIDLYQNYVEGDYTPGQACVHRNHYLLPIVGAGRVVDMLVCRLDAPQKGGSWPWTRLSGYGAQMGAVCSRVSTSGSRSPALLGARYDLDSRVATLSFFQPSQAAHRDADGSVPEWSLITRSYMTGNHVPNLVSRVRVRYQLEDEEGVPTIEASVGAESPDEGLPTWGEGATWGEPGVFWTGSAASFTSLGEPAGPDANAQHPKTWNVRRKTRSVRFQLTCRAPSSQLALRALELFVRPQGRI